MAGGVHCQVLVDFAYLGYLFQIAIHHLIAGNWKQNAFLGCLLVALIFLDDGEGYIKQWNVAHLFCFLPGFAYPLVAIVVCHDMGLR